MRVVVATEQRFFRWGEDVYVTGAATCDFWARYLEVFDEIAVLGRVLEKDGIESNWRQANGNGIFFLPIPHYIGPLSLFLRYPSVRRAVHEAVSPGDAVILRVPGLIATVFQGQNKKKGRPYGIEVVGDPDAVFQSGVVDHPFRPLFRWYFASRLREQALGASAAAYVTQNALQKKYPPRKSVPCFSYSSVELTDEAFSIFPRRAFGAPMTLVTVASLDQLYKGVDTLIDALSLCRRQGLRFKLKVMGDGRFRGELEKRARIKGLEEFVYFIGMLPPGAPVRQELDGSDLFVLATKTEGLPRALIEAMARGLPCICTAVGGIPELLDGEDLVPVNDPEALAKKITAFIQDKNRMVRAAERNRRHAESFHRRFMGARRSDFYRCVRSLTEQYQKKAVVP